MSVMLGDKFSPFSPGLGRIPKIIIERKILSDFPDMLSLSIQGKPKNIILIGERGAGKTVTLKILSQIAVVKKAIPITINCNETHATPDALSNAIYRRTYETLSETTGRITISNFIKKHIKPEITLLEISDTMKIGKIEIGKPAADIDQYNIANNLSKLIKDKTPVFLFDEAQAVFSRGVARFLINLFYSELPEKIKNFATVLCGTPILKADILEATPAYRAFPIYEMERFSKKETGKLLQETTGDTPVKFSDETCNIIWGDTKGIPYYLHYWGDYLYLTKISGIVDKKFYKKHRQKIFKQLGEDVLERRLETLERGKKREIYAAIADTTLPTIEAEKVKDIPSLSQCAKAMPSIPFGSVVVTSNRLWKEGYLTKKGKGKYVPADPVLAKWASKKGK